ncbi:MAG: segregation/condensation protein A [Nitrospinae bacterium]|nr:segregation/condensation protein A [Nitrospinota bacterium]
MSEYKVKLEVFEGPLDLLLHLIKEEELNIYDIPIFRITQQYFEYMEMMKQLNMDIAGEFLVMAATLIYIKSRMLLPSPPALENPDDESGVDPREELVRKLVEYKKYKEVAASLREREVNQSSSFARGTVMELNLEDPDYLREVSVFQLLGAFRKILKNVAMPHLYEVTLEDISVTERMTEIMELLEGKPRLMFEEVFANARSRMEIVGTFLSVLELMKQQLIRAIQDGPLGQIWLHRIEENEEADIEETPAEESWDSETLPKPSAYAFKEEDLPAAEDGEDADGAAPATAADNDTDAALNAVETALAAELEETESGAPGAEGEKQTHTDAEPDTPADGRKE